jgi:hypothetical protein
MSDNDPQWGVPYNEGDPISMRAGGNPPLHDDQAADPILRVPDPQPCNNCGWSEKQPYPHENVCGACRHAVAHDFVLAPRQDALTGSAQSCPECPPAQAVHPFTFCTELEDEDEDDDENHASFWNGENEVLFELDGLDDEDLVKFTHEMRALLDRYDAGNIMVNSSDW